MEQNKLYTEPVSLLSRMMANTFLHMIVAIILAIIITILLFLFMRFLVIGNDDSSKELFHGLFTLKTIVLPGGLQRPERVQRPLDLEEPPLTPTFSEEEIKQEALEFLLNQDIEEVEITQPEFSNMEQMRKKRAELISILEQEE